ncbi:hypothetical protein HAX54_037693, partial [Datura stramonium]|nr:hypothetical protein [Datura stramonium]
MSGVELRRRRFSRKKRRHSLEVTEENQKFDSADILKVEKDLGDLTPCGIWAEGAGPVPTKGEGCCLLLLAQFLKYGMTSQFIRLGIYQK